MRALLRRYREAVLYLLFGVCSTGVNVVVYGLCAGSLSTALSTAIAWAAAVLFAYGTNRTWVFRSRARTVPGVLREMGAFFACRLATGGLDLAVMYICVDRLGMNGMAVKAASNALVVALNYAASKRLIFSARRDRR